MAESASTNLQGWPFLEYSKQAGENRIYNIEDGVECFFDKLDGPCSTCDMFYLWYLRRSGLFFMKEVRYDMSLFGAFDNYPVLYVDVLPLVAAEAIYCLTKLYEKRLPEDEQVVLRFRLGEIQDRCLTYRQAGRHVSGSFCSRIPELSYEVERPLAEWSAGVVDHAIDLTGYVFERFNWDAEKAGWFRDDIEGMLRRKP